MGSTSDRRRVPGSRTCTLAEGRSPSLCRVDDVVLHAGDDERVAPTQQRGTTSDDVLPTCVGPTIEERTPWRRERPAARTTVPGTCVVRATAVSSVTTWRSRIARVGVDEGDVTFVGDVPNDRTVRCRSARAPRPWAARRDIAPRGGAGPAPPPSLAPRPAAGERATPSRTRAAAPAPVRVAHSPTSPTAATSVQRCSTSTWLRPRARASFHEPCSQRSACGSASSAHASSSTR